MADHGIVAAYKAADRAIQGWPDRALTVLLVAFAAVCVWAALSDKTLVKGLVVAWVILP